jgi:CHAD domain-containing protein
MAVELDSLQKPLRKLRKSLKRFPKDPPAEDVHQLRTQARRMEAMAAALMFDRDGESRHMLKTIAALRRAAGDVRDMDVLIANALDLSGGDEEGCVERLVDHLRTMRQESAGELHETIAERRKAARHDLKRYSRLVEKIVEEGKQDRSRVRASSRRADTSPVDTAAAALDCVSELRRWPRLHADNIHPFRVKVKTLRYVIELAEGADEQFVIALDEVKNRIGEWHDWHELRGIARKVLDHPGECMVRKQIKKTERRKLRRALAAANAMRERYLGGETEGPLGKKPPSSDHLLDRPRGTGRSLRGDDGEELVQATNR